MTDADIRYFEARLKQEQARAEVCDNPVIANIHRQMAEEYRALLGSVSIVGAWSGTLVQ